MNRSTRNYTEINVELERFRMIDSPLEYRIISVKSEGIHKKDSVNKEGLIKKVTICKYR